MQTQVGDIVIIHHQERPVAFARVEGIVADVKPGWWQIGLLLLQIPPQTVTWILRDEYIDGNQFTMDGETMRIERLPPPAGLKPIPPPPQGPGPPSDDEKVVSLTARRKPKN